MSHFLNSINSICHHFAFNSRKVPICSVSNCSEIFSILLNNRFSENYRSRTEQLIHGLGGEFIKIEKEDGLEEIIAQLKIKFIKMRTQLAEFENSDFHRMETDRVVRARIDLKGVEDQV